MIIQIYSTEFQAYEVNPFHTEKVSEYDQEIPQSHTADQPTAPWAT